MAPTYRPFGHLTTQELDGVFMDHMRGMEEGTICPGCESPIAKDRGVECYCAAEEFGRAHELYKWCSQDCFNRTHEDCHPEPPDREEYDA